MKILYLITNQHLKMIKLISSSHDSILAFRITDELVQDDTDWLIRRVQRKHDHTATEVNLYLEFQDFGTLTLSRIWEHFKMFLDSLFKLMKNVARIAVVSSNEALNDKLALEFKLVPTIRFKTFAPHDSAQAANWLVTNK